MAGLLSGNPPDTQMCPLCSAEKPEYTYWDRKKDGGDEQESEGATAAQRAIAMAKEMAANGGKGMNVELSLDEFAREQLEIAQFNARLEKRAEESIYKAAVGGASTIIPAKRGDASVGNGGPMNDSEHPWYVRGKVSASKCVKAVEKANPGDYLVLKGALF